MEEKSTGGTCGVPGVDGVCARDESGRQFLLFLSSREASAAASFLERADSVMSWALPFASRKVVRKLKHGYY